MQRQQQQQQQTAVATASALLLWVARPVYRLLQKNLHNYCDLIFAFSGEANDTHTHTHATQIVAICNCRCSTCKCSSDSCGIKHQQQQQQKPSLPDRHMFARQLLFKAHSFNFMPRIAVRFMKGLKTTRKCVQVSADRLADTLLGRDKMLLGETRSSKLLNMARIS